MLADKDINVHAKVNQVLWSHADVSRYDEQITGAILGAVRDNMRSAGQ